MRKHFVKTLLDSRELQTPYLLTGDLGYSVLEPFQERFPLNYFNFGILEQSIISIAAGIASNNNKVFVYSINNFATFRCLEQIRLDIAYHDLNVCVVGVGVGFQYQSAGYSHWGVEDLGCISLLERMRIFSPSDASSTEFAVRSFLKNGGPTYIRLGKEPSINLKPGLNVDDLGSYYSIGSGSNLIISHGPISWELINSEFFNPEIHKIVVVNEISMDDNQFLNLIDSNISSVSVFEEVIYPGSLGSRIAKLISTGNHRIKFSWKGIDGKKLSSVGGSESFLRAKVFGNNYIQELFIFD